MDERGHDLQTQLELMECTGRVVHDLVAKLLTTYKEQEEFHTLFANRLKDIAIQQKDATLVVKCFEELSKCSHQMAMECHNIMIQRPEREVLHVWNQIQKYVIVPMKKLLEDREKALKIEMQLQLEYEELKQGSAAKEKKLRMLSDQKRRVENVNALLETHMEQFDHYRTETLKKLVSELARSQAFYHAKGLELFAVPCQAIAEICTTSGKGTAQVVPADAT
ncbi:unnamed protein product [Peronospora farinosa]|uniref:BAR domain-containing protein n=1 Tax=Peronospora farinosa TaxID=134698 RepID=A0AAV0TGI5_9STRA|nr:unnamed protein product [Peronospora farinosa]CAI5719209.1 unnamed protein product [Peronospora farinosa]